MSHIRNLRIVLPLAVAAIAAIGAPSAQAAVCNQAGNGHQGGAYVSTGTPDPSPPARYKSGLQTLGHGKGTGLDRAAERSPALSQCGLPAPPQNPPPLDPPSDDPPTDGPFDGGGDIGLT
jgi:hypothetical protein